MRQSQYPGGWPSDDDDYECIDLTGSPDPSPRPQPQTQPRRQPQQQQLPKYFKREPKAMAASPYHLGASGIAAPNIHPAQLQQIIDTSDSTAIRNVLLNLCKLSPALSGAVARGLAPSSSYAQKTIKEYRMNATARNIKSDPGTAATPASTDVQKARPVTPSPQPHIKREVKATSVLSDDEDDLVELFDDKSRPSVAGPSSSSLWYNNTPASIRAPVKSEWPSTSTLPFRQSPTHDRKSASIKTEPALRRKCKLCHFRFENEQDVCHYHTGRKMVITNDDAEQVSVWSCCREPVYEVGCTTGTHIADPAEDLKKPRPLMDRLLTPYVPNPKKPRLQ
ncbi:hypothetical protein K458DRAFT_431356 [Lentithecium fluviatile CBS 122367]|uniref:C2H2-type domain-containing protein n=1 Tax=Lentithecium fluviatile CBS 122367 TaxID=1168545 RepID=A0A6G1J1K3_9PLEO|nr:hypothetical protein K458DRAFT_431356 [Lentithecium fluviatile CBS 122367]